MSDKLKLPFLPGNTFRDLEKSAFHRAHTLNYKNGYALARRPKVDTGQDPLSSVNMSLTERARLIRDVPNLTYGIEAQHLPLSFTPAFVAYDKKALRFYAYIQQEVLDSAFENFCIRPVIIYYYLEDDSVCLIEQPVKNSGFPQGKLIKRQRLPKNKQGEFYNWKDLNLGMDMVVYGTVFRITDCDAFTRDFMESQGIVLNESEPIPCDPFTIRRLHATEPRIASGNHDHPLERFLAKDRQVLRFFGFWDDVDSAEKKKRPVTVHYYLVDDSVEIRENHEPNSGRDPVPVLLRRQKIPKHIKTGCDSFPSCVLEVSQQEVQQYFSPEDFRVGEEVTVLGRRFLLCDCDDFTHKYFQRHHPEILLKPRSLKLQPQKDLKKSGKVIPPYNGFGTLEDSLQNCLRLIPEPPKKNVMKLKEDTLKVLRYSAQLDSQNPFDEGRRFVLSFHPYNDTISIFEKPTRNSGIIGGKFLEKTQVPKPGSSAEHPVYYTPADFYIGATIDVFGHLFVLTDADQFVLSYLESVADQIPEHTLSSLRQNFQTPDQDENLEKGAKVGASAAVKPEI